MDAIAKEGTLRTPVILRITTGRLNPYLSTLLLFLSLVAIWQLVTYLEGWSSIQPAFHLAVFFTVTITYAVMVTHFIIKGHQKDLAQIASLLPKQKDQLVNWNSYLQQYKSTLKLDLASVTMGLIHSAIGVGPFYRLLTMTSKYYFFDIWMTFLIVATWYVITQACALFVNNLRLFQQLVNICKIDILYTQKLTPFIRAGVRSTLAFIGTYALFPLLRFDDIKYLIFNPAILIFIPIVAAMILIPTLPLRRRIKNLKKKELELIEQALNGNKEAMSESRIASHISSLNIVDLLSYRKTIQNTKEIPVNVPIAFRFLLYILLPLLTWVAASLVDKIVVALLQL